MADKNVSFREPTIDDVEAVVLLYRDGKLSGIDLNIEVTPVIGNASYRPKPESTRSGKDDYPPGILIAIDQLVQIAVAKFKAGEDF